jgi:uncharacterized membrane protein
MQYAHSLWLNAPLKENSVSTPSLTIPPSRHSTRIPLAIFELLDPIPYGLFVGTLIFDVTYMITRNVFWGKGAAWLVTSGLFIAILPRLLNLGHVWLQRRRPVERVERLDFWLNLAGMLAAIVNAFVHSRDAYGMVPENVILSVVTVLLLSIARIALSVRRTVRTEVRHD